MTLVFAVNTRNYSLRESVVASIRFSEQVSLVVLLVAMFSCLSTGSPLSPVNASIVIVFVSVVMYGLFLVVCSPGEGKCHALPQYDNYGSSQAGS